MSKPKLEKLIQEIAMFDMVAAFTLYCRVGIADYKDKCDLSEVMDWRETPEGYEHWNIINTKLRARRKNYHPHRDLMIELANDKTTKIEFLSDGKDAWEDIGRPSFFDDRKYRKKPKVGKKVIECRLYLTTDNEACVLQSRRRAPEDNFKQWLGDWQKVEIEVQKND